MQIQIQMQMQTYESFTVKEDKAGCRRRSRHVASVSTGFIILRIFIMLLLSALMMAGLYKLTPQRLAGTSRRVTGSAGMILLGGLLFVVIRGGVTESTANSWEMQPLKIHHRKCRCARSPIGSLLTRPTLVLLSGFRTCRPTRRNSSAWL